jgi:hypothetical protein
MTFQAYLDTIRAKTGLGPADFRELAAKKGLLGPDVKTTAILAWLKEDFDLGSGHGMAIAATFKKQPSDDVRLEKQFAGAKAHWRPTYDSLLTAVRTLGAVETAPTDTYISLVKPTSKLPAKFAIVAFTAERMDIGIKLKSAEAAGRFESAGSWNAMVTHRVRVTDPAQVDAELLGWLHRAYEAA